MNFGNGHRMSNVVTLIADPNRSELSDEDVASAAATLKRLGADAGQPDWLATGRACDIPFNGVDADQADSALRHALDTGRLDIVAQPLDGRRKRLLIADMDSTIVEEETLDELAAAFGLKDRIAEITARAMNGEIEFKGAVRERVGLLAGLKVDELERTLDRVTLTPGAVALVRTMRTNDAYCMLVSGGFRFFTGHVRDLVGFHEDHANDLEIEDGCLTGRAVEPIRDKDDKLATLQRVASERGIPLAACIAVGDGANDLPMLQAAGVGVAFRAKPSVAAAARVRIDRTDLTSLLYLQGYRDGEILD